MANNSRESTSGELRVAQLEMIDLLPLAAEQSIATFPRFFYPESSEEVHFSSTCAGLNQLSTGKAFILSLPRLFPLAALQHTTNWLVPTS